MPLTDKGFSNIRKTFANGSSANIKFSKTQLSKTIQLGGFLTAISGITSGLGNIVNFPFKALELYSKKLNDIDTKKYNNNNNNNNNNDNNLYINAGLNMSGKKIKEKFGAGITLANNQIKDIINVIKSLENREILLKGNTRKFTCQEGGFLSFLRPLMATDLLLMKSVLMPLARSVLLPFGLSAEMSAADAAIQKKIYGSCTTALIISNEEMEDIMEEVKSLEESGLLIKRISETIKNEAKKQRDGFLAMLLETLAASILWNALSRQGVIGAGEGTNRSDQNF